MTRFFASRWGPILSGAVIGVIAAVLVQQGNPGNTGICVACFTRDIAGALGLHRATPVQYLRPELMGVVLGAFLSGLAFRELRPRTGSAPLVRFILGFCAAVGTLVFLGCTWRVLLRLSGGDGNALVGLAGLTLGIALAALLLRFGFSLGRNHPAPAAFGWVAPVLALVLLALLIAAPQFGRAKNEAGQMAPAGPVFFSPGKGPDGQKTPASRAPLAVSLAAGLLIGFLAQRSRFCTVGGIRDLILLRDPHLLYGAVALIVAALVTNLALGQFKAGFEGQPLAHTDHLWNFLGMALAGLAFTLGGGCPGRQLVLAGEGDGDAAVFALGMLAGTAFAHNFTLASSPQGPGVYGPAAVLAGLVVCAVIGLTMRERKAG
jgi:hypothetical protein